MRFGILAHSSEGAALLLPDFCRRVSREGRHMHPDVMLDCAAMGQSCRHGTRAITGRARIPRPVGRAARRRRLRLLRVSGRYRAHRAGASGPGLALPGLNIGDVVAERAAALGMTGVAVLGTRFTMAGPVYRRALPAVGIEPGFADDQERADIDRIIFDELVEGQFNETSRARYVEIIGRLKREEGCDGVALVCTEIPLLVTADESPVPIPRFDATAGPRSIRGRDRGTARAPQWRGGPID